MKQIFMYFVCFLQIMTLQASQEQSATFFNLIDTNSNQRIFPNVPPITPIGENTKEPSRQKKSKVQIVYYDHDWELSWLLFLKTNLDQVHDVHPPCYIEKRESYPRRRRIMEH